MPKETPGAAALKAALEEPVEDQKDTDQDPEDKGTPEPDDKGEPNNGGDVDYEAEFGVTEADYNEAVAQGWDPEYEGPNARSAKEFLERGSFFRKIKDQNKTIASQQKQIKFLLDRAKAAQKAGYEQGLAELKAQRREAASNDDYETVEAIEEKMDSMKEDQRKTEAELADVDVDDLTPEQQEVKDIVADFSTKHSWYDIDHDDYDPEMAKVADGIGESYFSRKGPPKTTEDVKKALNHIETRMRKLYPEELGEEPKPKAKPKQRVEGGRRRPASRNARSGGQHTVDDLGPNERMIMQTMIRMTGQTPEDYVAGLEKSGYEFTGE